jgi:hypothetical protein
MALQGHPHPRPNATHVSSLLLHRPPELSSEWTVQGHRGISRASSTRTPGPPCQGAESSGLHSTLMGSLETAGETSPHGDMGQCVHSVPLPLQPIWHTSPGSMATIFAPCWEYHSATQTGSLCVSSSFVLLCSCDRVTGHPGRARRWDTAVARQGLYPHRRISG